MDDESLQPESAEPSHEQTSLPVDASFKDGVIHPHRPPKNNTDEMMQGIKLTMGSYFAVFCLIELFCLKSADSIALNLWFSVLFLVPIWLVISLILFVFCLCANKSNMLLGVVIVTMGSLLLAGVYCAGGPR